LSLFERNPSAFIVYRHDGKAGIPTATDSVIDFGWFGGVISNTME
jgi:hypothetical protein